MKKNRTAIFQKKGPPFQPEKNVPAKPDQDPDPTKQDDPKKTDPTRIEEPEKNDPTRIDTPTPNKPTTPTPPTTPTTTIF
jgi:hypothetical protein